MLLARALKNVGGRVLEAAIARRQGAVGRADGRECGDGERVQREGVG